MTCNIKDLKLRKVEINWVELNFQIWSQEYPVEELNYFFQLVGQKCFSSRSA